MLCMLIKILSPVRDRSMLYLPLIRYEWYFSPSLRRYPWPCLYYPFASRTVRMSSRRCVRDAEDIHSSSTTILAEDVNGCTALFYAVTLQHSAACQVLLDLHANPNYQDTRGRT